MEPPATVVFTGVRESDARKLTMTLTWIRRFLAQAPARPLRCRGRSPKAKAAGTSSCRLAARVVEGKLTLAKVGMKSRRGSRRRVRPEGRRNARWFHGPPRLRPRRGTMTGMSSDSRTCNRVAANKPVAQGLPTDIMPELSHRQELTETIMEKELTDRPAAIHERITQLRDSL